MNSGFGISPRRGHLSLLTNVVAVAACALLAAALAIAAIWLIKHSTDQPQTFEFSSTTVPKDASPIRGSPPTNRPTLALFDSCNFQPAVLPEHQAPKTKNSEPRPTSHPFEGFADGFRA